MTLPNCLPGAMGGTELMMGRLYSSLPKELLNKFQIIPSRVRNLESNKKRIYYCHDLPQDPEAAFLRDQSRRDDFDRLVFVSHWQMQMFNLILGVPYRESSVIKNGIVPIPIANKPTDKIRLIYHTTPHRGLEILVPVFEHLANIHPEIELDVYSSFSIYGWSERDKPYLSLFDRCKAHPRIRYHGAVPNEQIREALRQSHIFAYPSIWPETSCLAAIEAMSAQNIVVCPNYAALQETCNGWGAMYQWSEDASEHANIFANYLHQIISEIKNNGYSLENVPSMNAQKSYYDSYYNWDIIKHQWQSLLESLA